MQRLSKHILFVLVLLFLSGCAENWLDRQPQNLILEEQVWNDPKMITGLLANYYDRLPAHTSLTTGWADFANYDEAMWSNNDDARNNIVSYQFSLWQYWDYGLVRDINLAIENIEKIWHIAISHTKKPVFSRTAFCESICLLRSCEKNGRCTNCDETVDL